MMPWVSRREFSDLEIDVYGSAIELVGKVPALIHSETGKVMDPPPPSGLYNKMSDTYEVRCHELTRAVLAVLGRKFCVIGWNPILVDGKWKAINHSWITWRNGKGQVRILDVYVPCSVPQVQIMDASPLTQRAKDYVPCPFGHHIHQPVIDTLITLMESCEHKWYEGVLDTRCVNCDTTR